MRDFTMRASSLAAGALLLALVGTAVAGPCAELQAQLGFPHCVELGTTPGAFSLAWQTDAEHIWLALDLTTDAPDAWAGVGISSQGGMKESDLIVVSKQADGSLAVQDLWSEQFGLPLVDASQDVTLVAPLAEGVAADAGTPADVAAKMTAQPGRLRALLRRKLHSCDTRDLSVTPGLRQPVVWAYGTAWPAYHGDVTRGNIALSFVPAEGDTAAPPTAPTGALPPNTFTMELRMPNVTIPTAATSYLCTHFQLPDDKKYHIIAQEGIIESPLVHHIILYGCSGPQPAVGDVVDCIVNEPQCSEFTIGWAPGQGYLEFPSDTGFPFGTGDTYTSWFSMQVHYSNAQGVVSAAPDTSGLRITYTSDARAHDLGILTLGQPVLMLPPAKSAVITPANICPGECTSRLPQPVTMLYSLLHMHQTGASIVSRHIRDGVELPPLGVRKVWDFNFQATTPIPFASRELRPGDSFITQCVFKTTDRTNITTFGQGTMDEMCFNFVMYYPRVPSLQLCMSNPTMEMQGHKMRTAMCAPPNLGVAMDDPQKLMEHLLANGYIVNATWPAYTKYTDPQCQAAAVQALGV